MWREKTVFVGGIVLALISVVLATKPADSQEGGGVDAISGYYPVATYPIIDPIGFDLDPETGYLYATDTVTDQVIVFDHSGTIVDTIGTPGANAGELANPTGIAIEGNEVYVVNTLNDLVTVYNRSGLFLRDFTPVMASTLCAVEVAGGRVFVGDGGDTISIMTSAGGLIDVFDGSDSGTAMSLRCIFDFISASDTELFVADYGNGRVVVFDFDGNWQRTINVGGTPTAIDLDDNGAMWIADFDDSTIEKWTTAGSFLGQLDLLGPALGQIDAPEAIVADPSGDTIWIGELNNGRLQIFTNQLCNGLFASHVGTSFDDNFSTAATGVSDVVVLGGGDDTVRTGPGDDTVCGDSGADTIRGGGGADTLFGGPGNDSIEGQAGTDTISGGNDHDVIAGQGAADTIDGNSGNDTIDGQNGADVMNGGAGDDTIRGQTGPDTFAGASGDDTMAGGSGNDTFTGGAGFDRCSGNSGGNDQAQASSCEQTPGIETLF